MDIPETDWKKFKPLREKALERYCERVLKEIDSIKSETDHSRHEMYLKIFAFIEDKDQKLEQIFDGYSRSRALFQLSMFKSEKLLEPADFECFSQETQDYLEAFST